MTTINNGTETGIFELLSDAEKQKPRVNTRIQVIERDNAEYIVRDSSQPLQIGDIVFSNGFYGSLQTTDVVNSKQFGGDVNIYVNPNTGDDLNSGDISNPLKTIEASFGLLKSWGSYFYGRFVINLSAGTYLGESAIMENAVFNERLRIQGEDVLGGTPTVILDGTGASSPYGMDFIGTKVRISDVKVINYQDVGSDIGIRARDFSDLYAVNVHSEACNFAGISVASLCRLRVEGGDNSNNLQFGIRAFGNSSFTIENSSASNNTQANFVAQDSCQGTLVNFTSSGSQSGVNLRNQCSARLSDCSIENASVAGVYMQRQSRWNNDSNTFLGNAANWIHETYSTEVEDYAGASGEQRRDVDLVSVTHTGDNSLTLIKTIDTLKANSFIEKTKKLRIRVYFTSNGAGGTKSVGVRFDGNNMATSQDIQAGNNVNGIFEVEVFPISANSQRVSSHLSRGTSSLVTMGWFDRSNNMTLDVDVRVYVQLSDSSDSITINAVESFLIG